MRATRAHQNGDHQHFTTMNDMHTALQSTDPAGNIRS